VELVRFAFSTHAYRGHSLQHALNRISETGFAGVELLADKPHAWMDTFTASDQTRLFKRLDKHKLIVSNINACSTIGFWSDAPQEPIFEPSLISHSREQREWRIAYVKKALRLGKALNAKNVSITSGRALNGIPPEEARKTLIDSLERVAEHAEKIGQRFSLTCEPTLLVERSDELAKLLVKVGSMFFGATVDVANAVISGEEPSAVIARLKGRIFGVQLADIKSRKYYRRIPGSGEIDFAAVIKALKSAGYTGPLTWDVQADDGDPDAACKKTFAFSKSITKK